MEEVSCFGSNLSVMREISIVLLGYRKIAVVALLNSSRKPLGNITNTYLHKQQVLCE